MSWWMIAGLIMVIFLFDALILAKTRKRQQMDDYQYKPKKRRRYDPDNHD
ncbi:MAG: hypothetical protein HQM07_07390 [Zetaproteobacteria bacterium]|nr:hypothetical protein [Zetaproteobacteria bacterium]